MAKVDQEQSSTQRDGCVHRGVDASDDAIDVSAQADPFGTNVQRQSSQLLILRREQMPKIALAGGGKLGEIQTRRIGIENNSGESAERDRRGAFRKSFVSALAITENFNFAMACHDTPIPAGFAAISLFYFDAPPA